MNYKEFSMTQDKELELMYRLVTKCYILSTPLDNGTLWEPYSYDKSINLSKRFTEDAR